MKERIYKDVETLAMYYLDEEYDESIYYVIEDFLPSGQYEILSDGSIKEIHT